MCIRDRTKPPAYSFCDQTTAAQGVCPSRKVLAVGKQPAHRTEPNFQHARSIKQQSIAESLRPIHQRTTHVERLSIRVAGRAQLVPSTNHPCPRRRYGPLPGDDGPPRLPGSFRRCRKKQLEDHSRPHHLVMSEDPGISLGSDQVLMTDHSTHLAPPARHGSTASPKKSKDYTSWRPHGIDPPPDRGAMSRQQQASHPRKNPRPNQRFAKRQHDKPLPQHQRAVAKVQPPHFPVAHTLSLPRTATTMAVAKLLPLSLIHI